MFRAPFFLRHLGPRHLLLPVLLMCTACFGELEDRFFIYGRAVGVSSVPLPLHSIALVGRDGLGGGWLGGSGPFLPIAETTTDAEGRYVFELYRYQLLQSDGYSKSMQLRVELPSGASTRIGLSGIALDQAVPDLWVWDAADTTVENPSGSLVLYAPPFPIEQVFTTDFIGTVWPDPQYRWRFRSGEQDIWEQPVAVSGDTSTLPVEVLEDFQAPVAEFGLRTFIYPPTNPILGTMPGFIVESSAPPLTLPPGPGTPVSRGKPCWAFGFSVPGCPATDGLLGPVEGPVLATKYGQQGQPVGEVWRVDLGALRLPRVLVVRGGRYYASLTANTPVPVEGSTDLQAWVPLGVIPSRTGPGPAYSQAVVLDTSVGPVRYVRLSTNVSSAEFGAEEISVFE